MNGEQTNTQIAEVAEAAVQMAAEQFDTQLDWSGESIQAVDEMLAEFQEDFPEDEREQLPPDELEEVEESMSAMASLLGAYVGEVIRRRVGGAWQVQETPDGPLVSLMVRDEVVFPPIEVFQRLTRDMEEPLWEHYLKMFPDLRDPGRDLVRIV